MAAIKTRFMDSSSLVRGSVVDLVADQALLCVSTMAAYKYLLEERVMVSVSVSRPSATFFENISLNLRNE